MFSLLLKDLISDFILFFGKKYKLKQSKKISNDRVLRFLKSSAYLVHAVPRPSLANDLSTRGNKIRGRSS